MKLWAYMKSKKHNQVRRRWRLVSPAFGKQAQKQVRYRVLGERSRSCHQPSPGRKEFPVSSGKKVAFTKKHQVYSKSSFAKPFSIQ